jgi:hypothetical protein
VVALKVQLDIDNQRATACARRVLSRSPVDDDEARQVVEAVVAIALEEYLEWMSGDIRHRSLTELQTERLERLFEGPALGRPAQSRLYNDFSLSYGQATYVARVLGDRLQTRWRAAAAAELLEALKVHRDAAGRNIGQNDASAPLVIRLSSFAKREFDLTFEQLVSLGNDLQNPTSQPSVGDLRYLAVASSVIVRMHDYLGER